MSNRHYLIEWSLFWEKNKKKLNRRRRCHRFLEGIEVCHAEHLEIPMICDDLDMFSVIFEPRLIQSTNDAFLFLNIIWWFKELTFFQWFHVKQIFISISIKISYQFYKDHSRRHSKKFSAQKTLTSPQNIKRWVHLSVAPFEVFSAFKFSAFRSMGHHSWPRLFQSTNDAFSFLN